MAERILSVETLTKRFGGFVASIRSTFISTKVSAWA
jgi:hypothetical protein